MFPKTDTGRSVSLPVLALASLAAAAASSSLTLLLLAVDGAASVSSSKAGSLVCANLCRRSASPLCVHACDAARKNATRPTALGPYLTFENEIQHVGITTSNLSRSVLFYTSIMGGVEVEAAGGDGWKGDDVYQLLMQAALVRGGEAAAFAANLSTAGPEVLNARYVSFDSMVLELLDYRTEEARLQRALSRANSSAPAVIDTPTFFPTFSPSNVAPSVAHNMHVSFNVRPNVDLNKFVTALETTSHAAGYGNVLCNRLVPVPRGSDGRANVSGVPEANNSFAVTDGGFRGWSLAYCKGPDGEQLEFNAVRDEAAAAFLQAKKTYFDLGNNPIW